MKDLTLPNCQMLMHVCQWDVRCILCVCVGGESQGLLKVRGSLILGLYCGCIRAKAGSDHAWGLIVPCRETHHCALCTALWEALLLESSISEHNRGRGGRRAHLHTSFFPSASSSLSSACGRCITTPLGCIGAGTLGAIWPSAVFCFVLFFHLAKLEIVKDSDKCSQICMLKNNLEQLLFHLSRKNKQNKNHLATEILVYAKDLRIVCCYPSSLCHY